MTVTIRFTNTWQLEAGLMQECLYCKRKSIGMAMRLIMNMEGKDEPIRSNLLLCGECATKAGLMNQGLGS